MKRAKVAVHPVNLRATRGVERRALEAGPPEKWQVNGTWKGRKIVHGTSVDRKSDPSPALTTTYVSFRVHPFPR